MTAKQLEILQHALGVDQYGCTPKGFSEYTRNHFCAGSDDEADCRELVKMGFAKQFTASFLPYFNIYVSIEGMKQMHANSPKPPRLTRSPKRYRDFLEAALGISFREWLTMPGRGRW